MSKRRSTSDDPGLVAIADLERRIVQAHDEKIDQGISADEVARHRPGVVELAAAVAQQLRAEYLARRSQQ